MTLVVSDTSPLRALHHLRLLPILPKLFVEVLVPPAVKRELESPRPRFEVVDVTSYDFFEIRAPGDVKQVQLFSKSLDLGEAEALALAIEIRADAILIDESAGRKVATQHDIPCLGTLGVLLQAKTDGHLLQIRPSMDRLTDELGFFISDELKRTLLNRAGE